MPASSSWKELGKGVQLGRFPTPGESRKELLVVRVDVSKCRIETLACASLGHGALTADQWARDHKLSIVINAGMFEQDHSTHMGYWKHHGLTQPDQFRTDYSSVAAFHPVKATDPPFRIFDTDATDLEKDVIPNYQTVIQNLRLIKKPGENRWAQQRKAWSEIALGEDATGHMLILFCPVGLTMHDLNEHLLQLPIRLVAAQHLEGGPEASLYLKIGATEVKCIGSYETDFNENDDNKEFWPIPNVIGISVSD